MNILGRLAGAARRWWRRRVFREGRLLSRFIDRDVRRDILVVSTSRLDDGVLTARVRTINVLYVAHGMQPVSDFGDPVELRVDRLWE